MGIEIWQSPGSIARMVDDAAGDSTSPADLELIKHRLLRQGPPPGWRVWTLTERRIGTRAEWERCVECNF